jgi:hypothetical protein
MYTIFGLVCFWGQVLRGTLAYVIVYYMGLDLNLHRLSFF